MTAVAEEAVGSLAILNTGAGDITVTFNQHDDTEAKRAIAMLVDMQKRGYAILVKLDDGSYTRAIEIDAARGEYVVLLPESASAEEAVPEKRKRGRPVKTRVGIRRAHAVGVARSAGG